MKDYLEAGRFVLAIFAPKQILRDNFAAKLVTDGQVWIDMLHHRNLLSHTYNRQTFDEAVKEVHARYLPAIGELQAFLEQEVLR